MSTRPKGRHPDLVSVVVARGRHPHFAPTIKVNAAATTARARGNLHDRSSR